MICDLVKRPVIKAIEQSGVSGVPTADANLFKAIKSAQHSAKEFYMVNFCMINDKTNWMEKHMHKLLQ